eukprot:4692194-Amphidinium_carterae.2
MAENWDQELPDFDGDAEIEACSDKLNSLELQTPTGGQPIDRDTAHIEEIPSEEEGIPTVWVDRPCKDEEGAKSQEAVVVVGDGQPHKCEEKKEEIDEGKPSIDPDTKEENPVHPVHSLSEEPKQEIPLVLEPASERADTELPTDVAPLDTASAEADTEMAPVTEPTHVTEPVPSAAASADTEEQRRNQDDGRVHLGMALEGVLSDVECVKAVLALAAERVGRANAETSRAKNNLREHLRTGIDQAWISVWHILFVAKGAQT